MASALKPGSSCLHCCCCFNYLFILKAEFLSIVPKDRMRDRSPHPSEAAGVYFLCALRCLMCFGKCLHI